MITLLFGAPGTGKSTYAKYLAEKTGATWVSTGNVFRELAERDERIKNILESGQLMPDDEVNTVIFQKLASLGPNFVLDGFPRTVGQAESFKKFIEEHGWKIGRIFKLSVPVETIVARMSARGRADDDPEVIRDRFNIFETQTAPVLSFFQNMGAQVTEIDNTPPIEEVKKEFDAHLNG